MSEFLKQLEDAGAAAVGFNCSFGPATIVDLTKKAREVCKVKKELIRMEKYHTRVKYGLYCFLNTLHGSFRGIR